MRPNFKPQAQARSGGPVTPEGIEIRNPHSIVEALRLRARDVRKVNLPPQGGAVWDEIEALCNKHHIKVEKGGESARSNKGDLGGRIQSFGHAIVLPKTGISPEELFSIQPKGEYGVWLATDCVQDPQNLGSIFRLASFFGVTGLLMTTERSAPMTGTVYDVATGGVETTPFADIVNLKHALEIARKKDIWILGTSEHAKESLWKQKLDRNWLIVVGNEEKGMRRLTEESCDVLCTIPAVGTEKVKVTSLNVSVATGIVVSWFCKDL